MENTTMHNMTQQNKSKGNKQKYKEIHVELQSYKGKHESHINCPNYE